MVSAGPCPGPGGLGEAQPLSHVGCMAVMHPGPHSSAPAFGGLAILCLAPRRAGAGPTASRAARPVG